MSASVNCIPGFFVFRGGGRVGMLEPGQKVWIEAPGTVDTNYAGCRIFDEQKRHFDWGHHNSWWLLMEELRFFDPCHKEFNDALDNLLKD